MLTRTRLCAVVAGLLSLVALALLIAGVPMALWVAVGSPFGGQLPSLHDVAHIVSTRPLTDSTVIRLVAIAGWVAWLQIVASTLVETVAWVRGRPCRRLRFGGPIQTLVRKLVATAALLASTATTTHLAAAPIMFARPAAVAAAHPTPARTQRPGVWASVTSPRSTVAVDAVSKSYTVVRYDTLWGLAQRHLGDPLRWRELFTLNQGRPQPGGRALTNPDLIEVGWTLNFPGDATGFTIEPAPAPRTAAALPANDAPTVEPGAPTSSPGAVARWPPPATSSITVADEPPTIPTLTPPPPPASFHATKHNGNGAATRNAHEARPRSAWPLVGGGLAAAGVVALLGRLRRVQQRHRPTGWRPVTLLPELERIERCLRRAADVDVAERLDVSLRAFAAGSTGDGGSPPSVLAVRADPHHVEVLLAAALDHPPKGFVVTDDERGWVTDDAISDEDLRALASGAAAPLPALVSIGTLDDEHILIDVETVGLLTVDGPYSAALVASLALQLATSTWVDHVEVLLVAGPSDGNLGGGARVRHVGDIGDAVEQLTVIAQSFYDALNSSSTPSTLQARFSDQHDDGWIPTILVSVEPVDDETVEQLRVIVGDGGRGVGAVVCSTTRSRWHAHVALDELILEPLGYHITPSLVEPCAVESIDALLTQVADVNDFENAEPVDAPSGIPIRLGRYQDPLFEIEVQVLGPVEIAGLALPIERRRCRELVAYLALHTKGVNDDQIKTVLWPERAPTDGTFNTTVSLARTSLGQSASGGAHFPHYSTAGHIYRLGPFVTTDVARFEARVAHAAASDADVETLRSALQLVRGLPFEGTRGFEWAYSEGIVARAEAMIADAAHHLAQLCLAANDAETATWATMQGVKASPGDETLYRDRMLACAQAGQHGGVEAAMDELCQVIETLEPYDALQPETLALYEQLSRRRNHVRRR